MEVFGLDPPQPQVSSVNKMPLATKADQELFQAITTSAGFAPSLARSIKIIDTDDVPPEDVKGRRKVDGWRMRYEGVVTEGEKISMFSGFLGN